MDESRTLGKKKIKRLFFVFELWRSRLMRARKVSAPYKGKREQTIIEKNAFTKFPQSCEKLIMCT